MLHEHVLVLVQESLLPPLLPLHNQFTVLPHVVLVNHGLEDVPALHQPGVLFIHDQLSTVHKAGKLHKALPPLLLPLQDQVRGHEPHKRDHTVLVGLPDIHSHHILADVLSTSAQLPSIRVTQSRDLMHDSFVAHGPDH